MTRDQLITELDRVADILADSSTSNSELFEALTDLMDDIDGLISEEDLDPV